MSGFLHADLLGKSQVAFVDAAKSPQNRCLVAGAAEAVAVAVAGGGDAFLEALQAACREVAAAAGGPLDLKPRGFVSKKYAYDGT